MTYFEYCIVMDKLDLKFDLSIMKEDIYQESVSSFFNKLTNAIINYINDCKELHYLYKEKKHINKGMKYLENLCNNKTIANQTICVRGYNGKMPNPLNMNDAIQSIKNLIAYSTTKIDNKLISQYLERYEMYKTGWDVFYDVKIKSVPSMCRDIDESLDKTINELKLSLKDLSSYFENASDKKQDTENKNIFKNFIYKIKSIIKKDINIVTMTFEIMKYEINNKFSKLTENTANKVVRKDISDKFIMDNSKFIKEIKYGDTTYKIYETEYDNVFAFIYGGSSIYVENGFFDLPKGYQLAILYHEIGHHQCKHFAPVGFEYRKINDGFDVPMEDTEQMVKRIKKDYNKFIHRLVFSPFSNAKIYENGEEFIYLLVEWEADRFASSILGKHIMRKALSTRFSNTLIKAPRYKDPEKEKRNYDFNMDRMKIRTSNI